MYNIFRFIIFFTGYLGFFIQATFCNYTGVFLDVVPCMRAIMFAGLCMISKRLKTTTTEQFLWSEHVFNEVKEKLL